MAVIVNIKKKRLGEVAVNLRLLSSFILISYVTMTTSMTLDLTELRNKVSKLKVNPRGNLWATGHFMGKKSVVDGSFMEPGFENVNGPTEGRDIRPVHRARDLQALLVQMLKIVQQTEREQTQDMLVVYYYVNDEFNMMYSYEYYIKNKNKDDVHHIQTIYT
uniref:Neuromedin Bb n=1 Tax=Stegastes partitus TaxID=144197 RepID=A0A3B5BBY8_9TELE